jgi:hypothetical protein
MGYAPSNEAARYIKKDLIKHEEWPWYILLLPNGKWGALWEQGLHMEYADCIYDGE